MIKFDEFLLFEIALHNVKTFRMNYTVTVEINTWSLSNIIHTPNIVTPCGWKEIFQFDELIREAPKKATLNFVTNLESGGAVKKEMWKTYKKEDLISYIRDYGMRTICECTKILILVSVEHELGRRSSPLLIKLLDYYVNRDEKEEPSYYMTRQCEVIYEFQG